MANKCIFHASFCQICPNRNLRFPLKGEYMLPTVGCSPPPPSSPLASPLLNVLMKHEVMFMKIIVYGCLRYGIKQKSVTLLVYDLEI